MKFIQDIEIIVIGNIVVITQNKMKKGKTFYHSRVNKNKKIDSRRMYTFQLHWISSDNGIVCVNRC